MKAIALSLGLVGLAWVGSAQVAQAQATRTWISGVGDDVNPCSRTAPCKTFAGAISKTAAAGEINCLDSGGFGAVTITKSIALLCEGVGGGILASGTNGININAGPNDIVYLSGLDIEGVGTGINGVNFTAGGGLHIRKSVIRGFQAAGGTGIRFAPASGSSKIYVEDTDITENGNATDGAGILIKPTGSGGANGALTRVQVTNNGSGIEADGTTTTGTTRLTIRDVTSSGNLRNGLAATGAGPSVRLFVDGSVFGQNATAISASGGGTYVALTRVNVQQNTVGLAGAINSYSDNAIDNNGNDGPTPAPLAHK